MLTKRIIPCLDINNGRTVKGVHFENLKDAGNPISLAKKYVEQGADELVFLDITATHEKRKTLSTLAKAVANELNIPFLVGGGINHLDDAIAVIHAGADKVSINSSAVKNPQLIKDIASWYGSQAVVVAIDAKIVNNEWFVFTNGGRNKTDYKLLDWVKKATDMGAGEILFTSMDHDGTKQGFAIEILEKMVNLLPIPVIASGGAGNMQHFVDVFQNAQVEAALAASIFHYGEVSIPTLKKYLQENKINVRI